MESATATERAPFGILLIQCDSVQRKMVRVELERAGESVVAVDSQAVALVRLKWTRYDLVIFSARPGRTPLVEDYEMLVDMRARLSREDGYELFAPGSGLKAGAVLVVPSTDPVRIAASMRAVRSKVVELTNHEKTDAASRES